MFIFENIELYDDRALVQNVEMWGLNISCIIKKNISQLLIKAKKLNLNQYVIGVD